MEHGSHEIVVITRPTELAGLRERFVTDRQVKFFLGRAKVQDLVRRRTALIPQAAQEVLSAEAYEELAEQAAAEFGELAGRDDAYSQLLARLKRELSFDLPVRLVDRQFLPTFDFGRCALAVVVGQDGLVANAAKYVGDLPIVAINPEPDRFDGILLPFQERHAKAVAARVLAGRHSFREVSLAEVKLNDGQRLLAFNDFFVGQASHVSARYQLEVGGKSEQQSSSGVLVSTGAGSTGWLSSVVNMARGVAGWLGGGVKCDRLSLAWEDRRLAWVVREPFISKHSSAELTAGMLEEGEELILESHMPANGVIFSDGVESDFLPFNSGVIARIGVSRQRARLVVG